MSYGKNPAALGAVGSFRQMSAGLAKNSGGKRGGGKGLPYFVDAFAPSLVNIDTVRLLPGQYLQEELVVAGDDVSTRQVITPCIKFIDHFDGHARIGSICSAGPLFNYKDKRKPCHGCDIYWATAARNSEGRFESSRMSRQNKYVFSVLDYGDYHHMPSIDTNTGKFRTNAQGQPYLNWVKCVGQGCDACRTPNIEKKTGEVRHWPLNWTQFQVLRDAESHIGKSCTVCGQNDCVDSMAWYCPHCGDPALDMSTTTLKTEEILQLTDNQYQCSSCGQHVLLQEHYSCRVCAPRGQQGVRATLFDVDLRLKLVDVGGKKTLQVLGWSNPRPVDPRFAEIAKPLDLVARYAPDSMDTQMEKFGPVPQAQQPQGMPGMPPQGMAQPPGQPMRQPVTGGQPAYPAGGFQGAPVGGFQGAPGAFPQQPQQPATAPMGGFQGAPQQPAGPAPARAYNNPYAPKQ